MATGRQAAADVEAALPAILALCPREFVRTVTSTVLNVAQAAERGGTINYRIRVRKEVSRQVGRLWTVGFLRSLTYAGNSLQHEVRRALPSWDGKGDIETLRGTVADVRAGLVDGTPVASHLDAGLAFLDAARVVMAVAAQVGVSHVDMVRRRHTWQRYVDGHVPPHVVRTSMLRMFRFGLTPALRARRAVSPALAGALPDGRLSTESDAMRSNAVGVVAAIANVFPGARFESLEASVDGDGRLMVVPSFGDGEMDLRLPLSHTTVMGSTEVMGGLLRSAGGGWGYTVPSQVVAEVADRAPASTRSMLDLWRVLTTDGRLDGFGLCVMGTHEILVGPKVGRDSPPPDGLGRIVDEARGRGIGVSLGLGAGITIGQAEAWGEWEVDRLLHVARLVPRPS